MRFLSFWPASAVIFVGVTAATFFVNEYYVVAGYMVLQGLIMATAWNILGGFTGYVNFGSAGFFALGAYTSVVLYTAIDPPLFVVIPAAAVVCGLLGLGAGYLTLRLRGVYFAIATLALAIVLETLMVNWEYVGGATGAFIITPDAPFFTSYNAFLFVIMLALAIGSVGLARYLNHSRIGRGLAAIRDDEVAAECAGVPTLRLKLISTTVMGAMMGVAGSLYPYFVTFVEPLSAFNLIVAVNAIAMPMIGGTSSWIG
ncbi:MAG: branched-chain amino acid ABC transporter permease, partial [Rhodospirillales bacterium]